MKKPELWKHVPSCWFDFQAIYDEAVETAPPGSTLIECGSFWGQSAIYLAEAAQLADKRLKVYSVDLWGMNAQNNPSLFDASRTGHIEPEVHAKYHNHLFETFAHFVSESGLSPDPLRIMRMESMEAAEFFADDDSVHFVFLDDDHDYPYVFNELSAWDAPGRILAGHDYTEEFNGVIRSVHEYFDPQGRKVEVQGRSWIVRS